MVGSCFAPVRIWSGLKSPEEQVRGGGDGPRAQGTFLPAISSAPGSAPASREKSPPKNKETEDLTPPLQGRKTDPAGLSAREREPGVTAALAANGSSSPVPA